MSRLLSRFSRRPPIAEAFRASLIVLLAASAAAQEPAIRRDTTHHIRVIADYDYTHFDDGTDAWHMASVSLGHRANYGSVTGRLNYANHFKTGGTQAEIDAYPKLGSNGVYLYLNGGYSSSTIFPHWRSGAEIFTNLPNAFEASLGYRQLRFDGAPPVTLYTGTLGKYAGNYWFSLRPYFRSENIGTEASATLTARRYFEDANHYVGARIGGGSTPSDQLTVTELARTTSATADIHGQNRLGERLFGTWLLGWQHEKLALDRSRTRFDIAAGLRLDF